MQMQQVVLPPKSAGSSLLRTSQLGAAPRSNVNDISIRSWVPSDASSVVECVRSAYGDSYFHREFYAPEKLVNLNDSGKIISCVATARGGSVVGHVALVPGEFQGTAELAMAFVDPRYRGAGILERMAIKSLAEASLRGFDGVYGRAVTSHPYSQKVVHKFGFDDTALLLRITPPQDFQALRASEGRRESHLHIFRFLKAPCLRTVYAPAQHKTILKNIYEGIGADVQWMSSNRQRPREAKSNVSISIDDCRCAHIRFNRCGVDAIDLSCYLRHSMRVAHAEAMFLYLPLAQTTTEAFVDGVEKLGFFFAGIVPQANGNDWLVLQYHYGAAIDYDTIRANSPMGVELRAYVKAHEPPHHHVAMSESSV